MRVLVVEDDKALGAFLRQGLELEGHEVRFAADGPAALREIDGRRPDCVVLDVMMPGMSGHEVLAPS